MFKYTLENGVPLRRRVRMSKFTFICTLFAYQDMKKCAKIYQVKGLEENRRNPRKYKEKRGYTKLCNEK